MSFIHTVYTEEERKDEMVFGLFVDGLVEVFSEETFDLSLVSIDKIGILDCSVVGVARRHLSKLPMVAPLVTYGVTVRGSAISSKQLDILDVRADGQPGCFDEPTVALYKQRKTDKDGKEYYVLSVGVSGEVYKRDICGYLQMGCGMGLQRETHTVSLGDSLRQAIMRHYPTKVELTSLTYVLDGTGLNSAEYTLAAASNGADFQCTFLRDGLKKPGYEGGAHVAAVYFTSVAPDTNLLFNDPDYEMLGWFRVQDLQSLAVVQETKDILAEEPDRKPVQYLFNPASVQERIGHLVDIPMEPWTQRLCMDISHEFDYMVRTFGGMQEGY
jgi:hypothetical protein